MQYYTYLICYILLIHIVKYTPRINAIIKYCSRKNKGMVSFQAYNYSYRYIVLSCDFNI